MKFKDGKTFSAYVRPKLHSGYITTAVSMGQVQSKDIPLPDD